jgi:hypothetical protein
MGGNDAQGNTSEANQTPTNDDKQSSNDEGDAGGKADDKGNVKAKADDPPPDPKVRPTWACGSHPVHLVTYVMQEPDDVKIPPLNLKVENWNDDEHKIRRVLGGGTYWVEAPKNLTTLSPFELEDLVSVLLNILNSLAQHIFFQLANSNLGRGIDLSSEERRCSRPPIVQPVSAHMIDKMPLDFRLQSTTVSYSSYEASYASAGWNEAGLKIASPVFGFGVSGGSSKAQQSSSLREEMWVTGRWSYTMCRLSLPVDLILHPDYKKAINRALEQNTDAKKRSSLQEVFAQWGFYFVAGIEMGGAQYITARRKLEKQVWR